MLNVAQFMRWLKINKMPNYLSFHRVSDVRIATGFYPLISERCRDCICVWFGDIAQMLSSLYMYVTTGEDIDQFEWRSASCMRIHQHKYPTLIYVKWTSSARLKTLSPTHTSCQLAIIGSRAIQYYIYIYIFCYRANTYVHHTAYGARSFCAYMFWLRFFARRHFCPLRGGLDRFAIYDVMCFDRAACDAHIWHIRAHAYSINACTSWSSRRLDQTAETRLRVMTN